ncbi:hypothetical protein ACFY12_10885 [Streptomyces sp. NPDC001339]|uniref:Rv1733c family protein n=1 Tax=Streptomyces sp. NPDC001339 TaxID=3364563 RepID=UPI0036A94E1B
MTPRKMRPPWRHDLLRRGTDVAQSWMALAAGLLIAVAAPTAGVLAGQAVDTASQQQRADWHAVTAVVTKEPPARAGRDARDGTGGRVHATVRWTASDHTVRTGETTVAPGAHAGDRTTVWLDEHGALLRDPSTPADILVRSVVAGTLAASGTGLLVFGTDRAGVLLLNRKRYAQWEKEWAELDAQGRHHRR